MTSGSLLRVFAFLLPAGLVLAPSAGTFSDRGPIPAPAAVTVVGMTNGLKFTPDTVTVRAGSTVQWKNTSDLVHTVTADPALATKKTSTALPAGAAPFNSGGLAPGDTFSHEFLVPGTYRYFCIPHEGARMIGYVIVTPD